MCELFEFIKHTPEVIPELKLNIRRTVLFTGCII